MDIMYQSEKLREVTNSADLVICATDNVESRALANHICVTSNKPLILVCTYNNAKIGEIIKVIPNQSACYECIQIHQREQGAMINFQDPNTPILPYSSQSDTKTKSIGTRTDIFMVAALAAKVALMSLYDDEKVFGSLPFNYITWGALYLLETILSFV